MCRGHKLWPDVAKQQLLDLVDSPIKHPRTPVTPQGPLVDLLGRAVGQIELQSATACNKSLVHVLELSQQRRRHWQRCKRYSLLGHVETFDMRCRIRGRHVV